MDKDKWIIHLLNKNIFTMTKYVGCDKIKLILAQEAQTHLPKFKMSGHRIKIWKL